MILTPPPHTPPNVCLSSKLVCSPPPTATHHHIINTYIDLCLVGPAQLSITCTMEKWGETSNFSHMSMTYLENGDIFRICFKYCSTDYTLNAWCV